MSDWLSMCLMSLMVVVIALADRGDALLHLLSAAAVVGPGAGDDWDVGFWLGVGRHVQDRCDPDR
jgi:hypothetical protein